jgi:hypothetical protein
MTLGFSGLIADAAAKHLKGIPWGDLIKTAPDVGLGHPSPLYSSEYIEKYMYPAFERAKAVMDTLDFSKVDWTSADALEGYTRMKEAAELVEGGVEEAIKAGQLQLTYTVMTFDTLTLQFYVLSVYLTALNSLIACEHAIPARWVTQAPTIEETIQRESQAMDQATLTVTMFETIVKLDEFHALSGIKKNATSGLGLWPIAVIGVIAVAAVAVIALIIWGLLSLKDVSAKNKLLENLCLGTKDASVQQDCIKAAADSKPNLPVFGNIDWGALGKWAMIGGLIVGGVYFAPTIVGKLFQARKVARSEA